MVFAIKMLLNNAYGLLNLLEFLCKHFNSLFQPELKNSNFGRKSCELLIQCQFPNRFDFSNLNLPIEEANLVFTTTKLIFKTTNKLHNDLKKNLSSTKLKKK